jgi:hypothetical protein
VEVLSLATSQMISARRESRSTSSIHGIVERGGRFSTGLAAKGEKRETRVS